jgi:LmbE family N-acetylglucosaminyl deacetylase
MIIKKRRLGATIYIVFMTDGRAAQVPVHHSAKSQRLRKAKARACASDEVPEQNLIFLGFEDGILGQHEAEAQQQVTKILRALSPAEVFVPFRHEAPADHHATFRIVRNALRENDGREIDLYEYFVWTIRLWFWKIQELYELDDWLRIDVREVLPLKKNALACYRSQTTILYPDPSWATLPKDLLAWSRSPTNII